VRKTIVFAVAFALGGSALSTNAFALASAYGGGHLIVLANVIGFLRRLGSSSAPVSSVSGCRPEDDRSHCHSIHRLALD
jgi:hypothetical protein